MTVAICRLSSTTYGRFSPAPTAMIIAWGGLITASNALMPNMPMFEIDAVPP